MGKRVRLTGNLRLGDENKWVSSRWIREECTTFQKALSDSCAESGTCRTQLMQAGPRTGSSVRFKSRAGEEVGWRKGLRW